MSRVKVRDNVPTLREFIKENESAVYSFCDLVLPETGKTDDEVINIFRKFGDYFRKRSHKTSLAELKIVLYSIAWKSLNSDLDDDKPARIQVRDGRRVNEWEQDLLNQWNRKKELDNSTTKLLKKRIHHVALEFRAPMILKDILHFEDEEILQILGSRWGVFRHRLHRGRLDLAYGLKGQGTNAEVHA